MSKIAKLLDEAKAAVVDHQWAVDKLVDTAVKHSQSETDFRNSFPLRPSSALKSKRDLYYGLCNFYAPNSIPVDPIRNPILLSFGHAVEKHLVEHLERAFKILYKNHRVDYGTVTKGDGTVITLSGEMDFCIETDKGETIVCDSKSCGKYAFTKTSLPKEEHIAQINLYMHSKWARDLNINRAMILYYCKDNSEVRIVEFQYNPDLANAVIERFQEVHDAFEMKRLPEREHVWGIDWQAEYSSFKTHDNTEFEVPYEQRHLTYSRENFSEMSEKAIISYIAKTLGNYVVSHVSGTTLYWLEKGHKGLKLRTKETE